MKRSYIAFAAGLVLATTLIDWLWKRLAGLSPLARYNRAT